jgi:hypothetical protein
MFQLGPLARRGYSLGGCAESIGHHAPALAERFVGFDGRITGGLVFDLKLSCDAEADDD